MLLQASDSDPALLLVFSIPLFALLIGLLAVYWDHKRKMEMIERGLVPEDEEVGGAEGVGGLMDSGVLLLVFWV